MKLLPYKEVTLETTLSQKEFAEKILNLKERGASGYYWFRRSGFYFSGVTDEKGLNMVKTVPYWNLSPVKFKGRFILVDKPLVIKLKIYNPLAWPVFIMAAAVSLALIYNYHPEIPWNIIGLIIILSWGIVNIPYQIEAPKALKVIIKNTESSLVG